MGAEDVQRPERKGVQDRRLELVSPCGVAVGLGDDKRSPGTCFRGSDERVKTDELV